jgi:hypothetical protein
MRKTMKIHAYSGWYLIMIGIIHNTIGLLMGWEILSGMASEGWWNTIERDGQINFARSAIIWFLLVGFFWWILGFLMQSWLNKTACRLPRLVGWGILIAGIIVSYLLPISGAWLFIPLGLVILFDPRASYTGNT